MIPLWRNRGDNLLKNYNKRTRLFRSWLNRFIASRWRISNYGFNMKEGLNLSVRWAKNTKIC